MGGLLDGTIEAIFLEAAVTGAMSMKAFEMVANASCIQCKCNQDCDIDADTGKYVLEYISNLHVCLTTDHHCSCCFSGQIKMYVNYLCMCMLFSERNNIA